VPVDDVDDLLPDRTRADACAAAGGVDLDTADHRAHEHRAAEVGHRARQVAGRLRGDAKALLGGEGDGAQDVLDAARQDDARGALVGGEVPGAARLVVLRVAGKDHLRLGGGRHVSSFRVGW
jgi:hypothetical protein